MKRFIFNLVLIVCSLSLTILILNYTCDNNAFSAEIETSQFPEEFLSQTVEWEQCELFEAQKTWRKAECADIIVPLILGQTRRWYYDDSCKEVNDIT